MKMKLSFILNLFFISILFASTPKIKIYKSQSDFEKGKPKGVSINNFGEIVLAPKIDELLQTDTPFLWSLATDSRGNIYVGGGNSGQIFKIDKNGKTSVYFEAPEMEIYALAVDNSDNLYVGTSPKGKVYKIPVDKKVTPDGAIFFDPEDIYIWAMVVDQNNHLYVATGEKGKIYRIDPNGQSEVFYESEESHIRCLTLDNQGNLILGTAENGLVVKLNPQGRSFVLFDAPLAEITGLAIDKKQNIYVAASGSARFPGLRTLQPKPATPESEEDQNKEEDTIDLQTQEIPATGVGRFAKKESTIYQIEKNGFVRTVWELRNEQVYSMTMNSSDEIILGTGDQGRLYGLTGDGNHTLLTEFDEIQITGLIRGIHGQIFLCTSNTGKVYRMQSAYRKTGEYWSEVIDAKVPTQWGSISWQAEVNSKSKVTLFTRSGNTEKPDKSWSDWSSAYTRATGEVITSPPARFIQFKARLTTEDGDSSPKLKDVSLAYLQKNVPPQITAITIHKPGEFYPESQSNTTEGSHLTDGTASERDKSQNHYLGRKTFKKGFRSVSWKAKDENGDFLTFDLFYRGEDEPTWKKLVSDFKGFVYSWDSQLLPDGRYFIKIVASDKSSNPPDLALSTEKISQPFVVDNTGPKISDITIKKQGKQTVIAFIVEDELSIVKSVEYGLNADAWKMVFPVDNICDSKREVFEIPLEGLVEGTNTIVIKARDFWDNLGFNKKVFKADK